MRSIACDRTANRILVLSSKNCIYTTGGSKRVPSLILRLKVDFFGWSALSHTTDISRVDKSRPAEVWKVCNTDNVIAKAWFQLCQTIMPMMPDDCQKISCLESTYRGMGSDLIDIW